MATTKRAMKKQDFVLVPVDEIGVEGLEKYQNLLLQMRGGKTLDEMGQIEYSRHMVQAAMEVGWYKSLPEGFDNEALGAMKPGNLDVVANAVMALYLDLKTPDESFT